LESDLKDGDQDGNPTDFPDVIETISLAVLQASSQQQPEDISRRAIFGDNESGEASSTMALSPRAYQLEMLDQSLRQNAIVVVSVAELPSSRLASMTDHFFVT
jgi:hypothetical protein